MYLLPVAALAGAGALAYQARPRAMDSAENRRAAARTLPTVTSLEGLKVERGEFVTSKGIKLHTVEFLPANKPSKGVIYVCHGYCDYMDWLWFARCVRLASEGYTCVGLDLEGHGRSDGILAYIPDFERMVAGAYEYFQKRKAEAYKGQKSFLMGESMGGAVALWMLLLFGQEAEKWNGAIFLAPMAKIAEDMVPPAPIVKALTGLSGVIPTWPIVPSPNVVPKAFRDSTFTKLVQSGPYYVDHPPRVATAVQLLNATLYIDKNMEKITVPFLLMHGAADTVTDPQMSQTLYDRSQSKDKTFKLYPEVWHSILEDPDQEKGWTDIFQWLKDRL